MQSKENRSAEPEVFNAIKGHFDCDIRRVKFISCLIVSLLKLNDCSLSEWSKGVCLDILLSSKYKRLQRLLCGFRFGQRLYFKLIWSAYGQSEQVVLTLDRTDYIQRGQTVQILMLGIAHKGVSIPLLWHTANREGNSSKQTRLALLKVLERWAVVKPGQKIYLTADRTGLAFQFIGKEMWTGWFLPVIRVRANAKVVNGGKSCRADKVFSEKRLKVLRKPRIVYGQRAYLTGMKLEGDDFLILMSRERVRGMVGIYAQRWQVERGGPCHAVRSLQIPWLQPREVPRQRPPPDQDVAVLAGYRAGLGHQGGRVAGQQRQENTSQEIEDGQPAAELFVQARSQSLAEYRP